MQYLWARSTTEQILWFQSFHWTNLNLWEDILTSLLEDISPCSYLPPSTCILSISFWNSILLVLVLRHGLPPFELSGLFISLHSSSDQSLSVVPLAQRQLRGDILTHHIRSAPSAEFHNSRSASLFCLWLCLIAPTLLALLMFVLQVFTLLTDCILSSVWVHAWFLLSALLTLFPFAYVWKALWLTHTVTHILQLNPST